MSVERVSLGRAMLDGVVPDFVRRFWNWTEVVKITIPPNHTLRGRRQLLPGILSGDWVRTTRQQVQSLKSN